MQSSQLEQPIPRSIEALTYKFYATVLKITDGDTLKVFVNLGFDVSINISIRIKGINAPELNKPESAEAGKASRDYLASIVPIGSQIVIHTEKYRQSFTRFVGDVYTENGSNVAKLMVDAGFAVIY